MNKKTLTLITLGLFIADMLSFTVVFSHHVQGNYEHLVTNLESASPTMSPTCTPPTTTDITISPSESSPTPVESISTETPPTGTPTPVTQISSPASANNTQNAGSSAQIIIPTSAPNTSLRR